MYHHDFILRIQLNVEISPAIIEGEHSAQIIDVRISRRKIQCFSPKSIDWINWAATNKYQFKVSLIKAN